jgi:hypothetical protein
MINLTMANTPLTTSLVTILECLFWDFLHIQGKHNDCPCSTHHDTPGKLHASGPCPASYSGSTVQAFPVRKPESEDNHSPTLSAKVKHVQSFTSTPSCAYVV